MSQVAYLWDQQWKQPLVKHSGLVLLIYLGMGNRTGSPISSGKGNSANGDLAWWAFKQDGYEIEESFAGDAVEIEVIWKQDKSAISDSEQRGFLRKNSQGSKWGEPQSTYKGTFWRREDGATALYSSIDNQMTFGAGPEKGHHGN